MRARAHAVADAGRPEAAGRRRAARGSTSHVSPAPSVVSASSSLPVGRLDERAHLRRRVGRRSRRAGDDTASTSWRRKRSDAPTEPTRITRLAAEHFWPAWPKALTSRRRRRRGRGRRSASRRCAFLPLVSASSGRSARHERNSSRRLERAGEDHAVDRAGAATSRRPRSPSSTSTSASTSRGTPASHRASTSTAPQRGPGRRGLDDDAAARGERREHADPAGIATGKFHGGVTTVSARRARTRPRRRRSSSSARSA